MSANFWLYTIVVVPLCLVALVLVGAAVHWVVTRGNPPGMLK